MPAWSKYGSLKLEDTSVRCFVDVVFLPVRDREEDEDILNECTLKQTVAKILRSGCDFDKLFDVASCRWLSLCKHVCCGCIRKLKKGSVEAVSESDSVEIIIPLSAMIESLLINYGEITPDIESPKFPSSNASKVVTSNV